jgi:hypothetical protein
MKVALITMKESFWLLGLNGIAVHMLPNNDVRGDAAVDKEFTFIQSLTLALAICGGVGHGVAMAVRKKCGEGHVGSMSYWYDWKWWVGTWMDGFAGMLIWPAMPLISVQLLMPMVVVSQLVSSYLLGVFFFGESASKQSMVGLSFAVIGVFGLSMSTPTSAAPFHIDDYFSNWVRPQFLSATCVCILILATSFSLAKRSTFCALMAGFLEGVQFLCSRAMVDAAFDNFWAIFFNPAVFACVAIKGGCILSILSLQQAGLESDMSRFAGIYLIASVLFICTYGAIFFGDHVPLSLPFAISSFSTLLGIWCLNEAVHSSDGEEADGVSEPLLKGADVEAALAGKVA